MWEVCTHECKYAHATAHMQRSGDNFENLFPFSIVRSGTPTQIIRSVQALLPTDLYR